MSRGARQFPHTKTGLAVEADSDCAPDGSQEQDESERERKKKKKKAKGKARANPALRLAFYAASRLVIFANHIPLRGDIAHGPSSLTAWNGSERTGADISTTCDIVPLCNASRHFAMVSVSFPPTRNEVEQIEVPFPNDD